MCEGDWFGGGLDTVWRALSVTSAANFLVGTQVSSNASSTTREENRTNITAQAVVTNTTAQAGNTARAGITSEAAEKKTNEDTAAAEEDGTAPSAESPVVTAVFMGASGAAIVVIVYAWTGSLSPIDGLIHLPSMVAQLPFMVGKTKLAHELGRKWGCFPYSRSSGWDGSGWECERGGVQGLP